MIFRRSPRKTHRVPDGERVYAIGDVHGRLDLLEALLTRLEEDDRARGPARTSLIFLGDLVDRGPQSAQVVALVKELCDSGVARLIIGNHEETFTLASHGDPRGARALCSIGGYPTIRSYGISDADAKAGSFADLAELLARRIPRDHVAFLESAHDLIRVGDYAFVHAGVRPGVPLDEQVPEDLRWIRSDFLRSERNHGAMIVHGHTITEAPEERVNRIGIDTGAFSSGVLTALALEGDERRFIVAEGEPGDGSAGEW